MLSLLATLLVSAPLMAAPSASVTCADGPASCDAAWVFMGAPDADRDEPRDYATPAEVECPTPATGEDALGECAYEGPLDLWYRMSRFAEPDPGAVGTAPARRSAIKISGSSYGVPHDASQRTAPDAPQMALFAVPALTRPTAHPISAPMRAVQPRGRLRLPNARPGPDAAAAVVSTRARRCRVPRAPVFRRGVVCEVFSVT